MGFLLSDQPRGDSRRMLLCPAMELVHILKPAATTQLCPGFWKSGSAAKNIPLLLKGGKERLHERPRTFGPKLGVLCFGSLGSYREGMNDA